VATSAGADALTAANQHAAGTANASAVSCGHTEHVFPTLAEGLLSSNHHGAASPALLEKLAQLYPPDVVNSVAAHIYNFPLTPLMDYALTNLHAITGLPWWASIVAMTMLLRVAVLPLNISFMRHQLRVKCIQPLLARHYAQLKAAGTPEEAHAHARETLSLLSAKKARPLIAWWTPVVFPLYFVSWFAAVHNHSISNPELLTGGTLWFSDLTATDATFLLPVAASLTWLGIIEMGASALYLQSASLKMWTRFTALALVPVLSTLPSGVFCFWVSSNLWELVRIHLFNKDSVRKVFGIPLCSELPAVTPVAW
jgi:YidC/Oxa1 family membrane protein insertase